MLHLLETPCLTSGQLANTCLQHQGVPFHCSNTKVSNCSVAKEDVQEGPNSNTTHSRFHWPQPHRHHMNTPGTDARTPARRAATQRTAIGVAAQSALTSQNSRGIPIHTNAPANTGSVPGLQFHMSCPTTPPKIPPRAPPTPNNSNTSVAALFDNPPSCKESQRRSRGLLQDRQRPLRHLEAIKFSLDAVNAVVRTTSRPACI